MDGKALVHERVLVVDELACWRLGACHVLGDAGFEIAGEADSARAAEDLVFAHDPATIVLGRVADADARTALRRVRAGAGAGVRVLVCVPPPDEPHVAELLRHGADGVVKRNVDPYDLLDAVRALGTDRRPVAAGLANELTGNVAPVAVDADDVELSLREREVLACLASGATNREIAVTLSVSLATVKSHLVRLYAKLGVTSRADALRSAVARGWLS